MNRALFAGLFAFAILAGCESEPTTPETAAPLITAVAATAAPAAAAAPVEEEPAAEEVPVPEDFEQEATRAVQEQNYRAELDRIAREITKGNQ